MAFAHLAGPPAAITYWGSDIAALNKLDPSSPVMTKSSYSYLPEVSVSGKESRNRNLLVVRMMSKTSNTQV